MNIRLHGKKLEYTIIFVATLTAFLVAFLSNAISIAIPLISKQLSMNNIAQNWIGNIFFLVIAIFSIPFGKLAGKIGLKKSLIVSTALFLIGSIGSGIANSANALLFIRAFQGVGAALINVSTMALLITAISPKKRGKAVGLNVSGVYIGLSLAPPLGGFLAYNFGWESIFFITIPFLILALILLFLIKDEWKTYENEPIDKFGSILYAIGILFFIYGFSCLNELNGIILTVIGLILLIIFIFTELKIKTPILNVRLFKNQRFTFSNVASLISYLDTMIITYVLNYHFQYILGMNTQTAGLLLIITPIIMVVLSPITGNLTNKINGQKLSAIGMCFVTVAILILCSLNESTSLYIIILAMVIQGLGYGLFTSPNTSTIMASVPENESPTASATLSAVRVTGQTMSIGILTVIFAIVMGNVPIIPQYYPLLIESSHITCIVAAILSIIAIFASLVGFRKNNPTEN